MPDVAHQIEADGTRRSVMVASQATTIITEMGATYTPNRLTSESLTSNPGVEVEGMLGNHFRQCEQIAAGAKRKAQRPLCLGLRRQVLVEPRELFTCEPAVALRQGFERRA